jgi:hypothetical protein
MKFVERGLILLCVIGYYLAVWNKPADMSVLFVGAALLGLLYLFFMPALLHQLTLGGLIRKAVTTGVPWHEWVVGIPFGVFSGYTVFSVVYYGLGEMMGLALAENCGLGIVIFGITGGWLYRRKRSAYYRHLLQRVAVLATIIIIVLITHQLLLSLSHKG